MGQDNFKCKNESSITESHLCSVTMSGNIYYLFFFPPKGRSDRHNHSEKTGHLQKSETVATMGVRDSLALKDLTAEQLQHILNIVETTCCQGPSETHNTRGKSCNVHCWIWVLSFCFILWGTGISADSSWCGAADLEGGRRPFSVRKPWLRTWGCWGTLGGKPPPAKQHLRKSEMKSSGSQTGTPPVPGCA